MPLRARLSSEAGFTIVETLAAALVLVVALLGTFVLVSVSTGTTLKNRAREGGLALARELLESARSLPYSDLTAAELEPKLKAQPGLADTQAGTSTYTIKRRGTLFTVEATVCSYDDPADQSGPHGGGFCADSPGGASGASLDFGGTTGDGSIQLGGGTPDDYKRVVVTLSWKQGQNTRSVTQRTLIQNPGNANGPAVTAFTPVSPATTEITSSPAPGDATYNVKTSHAPALLNWSVDGTVQGSIRNPGTSYNFSWPIAALSDGDYIVSVQAYDADGLSGASRSLTVKLNRNEPAAPTGVEAGRNGSVAEIEWLANSERDIAGYRVFRIDGSTATQVCPAASTTTPLKGTSCQDPNPPATGTLTYKVAAVDRSPSGAFRAGALSAPATAPTGNTRPNPPSNLTPASSGGSTILRWTAPAVADPDPGDSIAFYRIYRDGIAYEDRYDRTSALSYTDTATSGNVHTYYVTAVDTHLAESAPIGPVTK